MISNYKTLKKPMELHDLKKSTKNIAKNIIWCFVITTPNLNWSLFSSNTIARI